ncbi:sensor histidine kinase [Plebeiibacterium sediminum]|uniref:histidine kinase n=1 Tax=Plebeiibacterium sediminum TaxID=2992112 RepID=A0AAE3M5Z5_9BACT|nr:HAMP domain-containing sensor histidine kinase [Plebeiobacterium sediminum]MCW3787557.1 HAMP domain-containing histidine kinase [Plebeiobacterium sediminum]
MNPSTDIKKLYRIHTQEQVINSLRIKLPIIYVIVGYFMFSDIYFRDNVNAFYTRLLPISLALILNLLQILKKSSIPFRVALYNTLIASLLMMMYGKCFIHLNDYLTSSITGTVLVLFLISLELKVCIISSILIYLTPSILFTIILFTFKEPSREQLLEMTNIIPIIIFGFIANQIQNKFRFKSFEKQHLLEVEQNKVKALYTKSIQQNKILSEQKDAIEIKSKELTESKINLEITNQAKDKFISIISHDLKNPFNVIIGFSDLLMHSLETFDLDEIKNYTSIINSSAKQTYNLFENLLNWALLQNNSSQLSFKSAHINKIIEDTISLLEPNFLAKQIQFKFTYDAQLYAEVDDIAISTVFRNLITNALKYTNKGGQILMNLSDNKEKVIFKISDTGVGMNQATVDQLFLLNSNIQTKGTADETGTGLGLVLCAEIIKKHNGFINAESHINKGSTFTVTIPIHHTSKE